MFFLKKVDSSKSSYFYLGVFTHFCVLLLFLNYFNAWYFAQTMFIVPLFCAFYLLFYNKLDFFGFSIIFLFSYLAAILDFFDSYIYGLFIKFDLFPSVIHTVNGVNPQFTKLFFFY